MKLVQVPIPEVGINLTKHLTDLRQQNGHRPAVTEPVHGFKSNFQRQHSAIVRSCEPEMTNGTGKQLPILKFSDQSTEKISKQSKMLREKRGRRTKKKVLLFIMRLRIYIIASKP